MRETNKQTMDHEIVPKRVEKEFERTIVGIAIVLRVLLPIDSPEALDSLWNREDANHATLVGKIEIGRNESMAYQSNSAFL